MRSRSFTPRWSNATATFIGTTVPPLPRPTRGPRERRYDRAGFCRPEKGEVVAMNDVELWRELGQQLRVDAIRPAAKAGSGHPTSGMSAADLMAVLLAKYLRYDFDNPHDPHNDRLVFSKGHASTLLYAMFRAAGAISEEELLTYRQFDSIFEGHPTPRIPWVDVATGSLGQGLSVGLGNALAARIDKRNYNTYVLLGDGECAEGSVWEAAEIASYYKRSNLFAVVDVNGLGQSQRTMDQFDVNRFAEKFRAFGWYALTVDGHNYVDIVNAFETFRREGGTQPRALVAKTFKGKGVSLLENKEGWHGKPVPKQDLPKALAELDKPLGPNEFVPNPRTGYSLPQIKTAIEIKVSRKPDETAATREAYGDALVKVADQDPRVVGLDGDT